jgi:aryl-alcohol dehydrogenase-like predicted oxidoreductase
MSQTIRTIAGAELHPVGLGCMNLSWAYGTPPNREEGAALLDRALDLGYNHLDTARIYGAGQNEALIGETLKGRRNAFFLASKCGITVDGPRRGVDCSPPAITEAVEASLRLLQTDRIDLYYMHRFDPKVPIADSVGALALAVEAGKIGAYGVSEWSAAHIREAHAVHPVGAVQTEYSLWTRNVELGVLETCRALGIALVAFSPRRARRAGGAAQGSGHARGQRPQDQDAALQRGELAAQPRADRKPRRAGRQRGRDRGAASRSPGCCRAASTST